MPRLSLAMIVKNEEEVLGRCLESFKTVVDEIVIVDTGSTDRTVDIAKKYTHNILFFKWIDDFAAARNYSFEHCSGDFIIWCDADDIIKPDSAERLKNLDLSDKEVIICPYIYFHDPSDNPALIVPRERIIKRSLGLKWVGEIHEYISFKGAKQTYENIEIHQYRKRGTSERNLAILEKVVKESTSDKFSVRPDTDPRNIYYLGKEYFELYRYDDAIPYLERYVDTSDGKFRFWEDYFQAYYKLAVCYLHKKDEANFKRCIFESIKQEDRRAEPYCLLGEWYMNRQDWVRALQWYKTAMTVKRPPELLSSYMPMYYTWLPYIQAAVCAFNLGNLEEAYEYNEKFISYCPNDSRGSFNRSVIENRLKELKRKDGQGKKLNIGCGDKPLPGYVNVDIYKADYIDEIFELDDIPYRDETISAIYSEHALEHVSCKRSHSAIKEWYRVLIPGGKLELKIPDFELCCQKYLESNSDERLWYKYTIYGYQKSLFGEPNEAQIHKWGYSKSEIKELLETTNFIIEKIENYDGYKTPSIHIEAIKPCSSIRVGWICGNDEFYWNAVQTRLRVLRINEWLQKKGINSKITNYEQAAERCDVIIVGKGFDKYNLDWIKKLKELNKVILCDLCEDIVGWPYVNDILLLCDKVICCSRKLEERVKTVNPNTTVIEEAFEF